MYFQMILKHGLFDFLPILRQNQYNKKMFTTNQVNQNVLKLLGQIRNSQSFKGYQQGQCGRGLFGVVKNSFEEMVIQLEKFVPRCGRESTDDIYAGLVAGRKIWAYYEFKMFAWIVAWLQFTKTDLHQTSTEVEMAVIEGIFPNKCQVFLRYEYFLLTSKSQKIKCLWLQEQVDSFAAIVKQLSELEQKRGSGLNWKFISFRLYNEFGFFKTPNQCRERWSNHLNPKLNKTKWHPFEDLRLLLCYQQSGSKWASIARMLKNRTQHMVKNRFNSLRHKWLKLKKPNNIFNINLLIRQIKENIKYLEIKQEEVQQISERDVYSSNREEEKPFEPMVKIEESPVDELSDYYPGSSVAEAVQEQAESHKSEDSAPNICPAALSLADVGGEIETKRENKNSADEELMNRHRQYEMLLEDPLWKDSDRVPTGDFDWLEDMIEERNFQYADEFM